MTESSLQQQNINDLPQWQQIWSKWALATIVGSVVGALFGSVVSGIVAYSGPLLASSGNIEYAVAQYIISWGNQYPNVLFWYGVMSAIQWHFVLRLHSISGKYWIVLSLTGALLGMLVSDLVQVGLNKILPELLVTILNVTSFGLVFGLLQGLLLQRSGIKLKWWVLINSNAQIASWLFSRLLPSQSIIGLLQQQSAALWSSDNLFSLWFVFVPINTLYGLVTGIITGIITGFVIGIGFSTNQSGQRHET